MMTDPAEKEQKMIRKLYRVVAGLVAILILTPVPASTAKHIDIEHSWRWRPNQTDLTHSPGYSRL